MDAAAARVRLKAMTTADSAPVLSVDELTALLSMAALADADGRAPTDVAWDPTYDLNRAAAEGWRWKVGKLAGSAFDFTADGATFDRSQMVTHCEKMIAQYQRKIVGSAVVYAPIAAAYPAEDEADA